MNTAITAVKKADDDFRPLGMNMSTVGRFGGAGLMGGSSAAAALLFVKMLRDMSDDKAKRENAQADDANTLTLTLPKRAEAGCGKGKGKDRKAVTDNHGVPKCMAVSEAGCKEMPVTTPKQIRQAHSGHYGDSVTKRANWQTLAGSLLAMGAGGTLGFSVVNKVYDLRREKELQAELETAKREYLDQLQGAAGMKSAQDKSFSTMDYPLGVAALLFLLGTGGTAWMTKKFLDEYNKTPASTFKPAARPKIDRILFQTEGAAGKSASADDGSRETFDAALGVYLDLMSGSADVLGDAKCAGADAAGLYKMAAEDFDNLIMYLKENPELRRTVRNVAMDQHPILKYFKWAAGLPGVNRLADTKLYDGLNASFGPEAEIMRQVKGAAAPVYTTKPTPQEEDEFKRKMVGNKSYNARFKKAGVLPMNPVATMLAGSAGGTVASMLGRPQQEAEQAVAEAEPAQESREERDSRIDDMIANIQVGAGDPEAAEFVKANGEKLRSILIMLAEEGKI